MDFKPILFIFLPLICGIAGQSGSSFFYYYSPKQPMIINSQTFGTNAQSLQRLLQPANNPFNFNFNPSSTHQNQPQSQSNSQNPFPTVTPFIPQRTAFPTIESIREKIAFTNAPAIAPQRPEFLQPQRQAEDSSSHTSTFPGQPQPSAKLFNFLNQPFNFFQNSFNRFPQTQTTPAPPPTQNYYTPQQHQTTSSHFNQNHGNVFSYYHDSQAQPQPTPAYEPATPPTNYGSQNTFRNYNNVQGHQGDAVSYAVNQYYSSKNAQGPSTSYSLTIGADPTTGPTATVHVNMGRPQDTHRFQQAKPQRVNIEQGLGVGQNLPHVEESPQSIEVEQSPVRNPPSLLDNRNEPETLTTTTTATLKPEVILMVVTAPEPALPVSISITTAVPSTPTTPETIPTTTTTPTTTTSTEVPSTSTTTATTTTTPKPTVPSSKPEEFRTPKRIIIRKKIARKRIRVFNKERTPPALVASPNPDIESIDTPGQVFNVNQDNSGTNIIPASESPELTTKRIRTRTRVTTTSKPELIEITTFHPPTLSSFSTTERFYQTTNEPISPEDHVLSTEAPTTSRSFTTETPFSTPTSPIPEESSTTTQPPIEPQSIVKQSSQLPGNPSNDNFPVYDENDYEYYYTDGDTPSSNEVLDTSLPVEIPSSSTPRPLLPSKTTTTTTEESKVSSSGPQEITTPSSTTSIPESSSTTEVVQLQEDVIEPLSTTETLVADIRGTTEFSPSTTEIRVEQFSTTTERIEEITDSVSPIVTTTETPVVDVPNQKLVPDQVNTNTPIEVSSESPLEIGTESSQPDIVDLEVPSVSNQPDSVNGTKGEAIPEEIVDDFQDQYVYSQEEEYVDPHADEKIKEAQRQAHLNALKNIRNRLQNASTTTTEAPEEDPDSSKKFVRKPTNVTVFPAGSSASSFQNTYDEEELGDSRSQIIQKIQTFRTKLRRVASSRSVVTSSNSNSIRSTTKRPRRVTRPSEPSTSTTTETVLKEEPESNEVVGNSKVPEPHVTNREPVILPSVSPSPPPQPNNQQVSSTPAENKDSFSNVNYDVNEVESPKLGESEPQDTESSVEIGDVKTEQKPAEIGPGEAKTEKKSEQTQPDKNSTLHVGELIIHEILPTQSATMEPLSESTENVDEGGLDDNADFQTYSMEDEAGESSSKRPEPPQPANSTSSSVTFTTSEIVSSTSEPILAEELSSTITSDTDFPSSPTASTSTVVEQSPESSTVSNVTNTTTTLKPDVLPQRKVKVILKRRKGAPPGSGTIARQVVRTRTRQRQKVQAV